jgi:Ca2+-binding EF-hand superfamily protein
LEVKNQTKIEGDTSKLNKSNFIAIMKNIYMNSSLNKNELDFDPVFDLIFRRFKLVKYDIKSESIKIENINNINQKNIEKDVYYVNDILQEDKEIDVYEIAIALSIYIKCDFKEKIKLLFDITDVDEDGYINENEIRYMITTVNFIFSDEESLIGSNSTIVNQSLSNIKSQQIFNMIMNYVKIFL